MSEHTKTPWEIKESQDGHLVWEEKRRNGEASHFRAIIRKPYDDGRGGFQVICELDFGYGRKNQEADARFILKACNAFDTMVDVVDKMLAYVVNPESFDSDSVEEDLRELKSRLEAQ